MRSLALVASLGLVLVAPRARAQDTQEPAKEAPPAEAQAPAQEPAFSPAPAPSAAFAPPSAPPDADRPPTEPTTEPRSSGLRLGVELGFVRANDARATSFAQGSPSFIPIGVDVSLRTSAKVVVGLHASAALASRNDCGGLDECTARQYTLGAHIETAFGDSRRSVLPWFRYGLGGEMLYRKGMFGDSGGHAYRTAIDLADARLGVDFALSRQADGRAIRLGPYAGLVAGTMVSQDGSYGTPRRSLDNNGGEGHLLWVLGARGTLDP